jgi:hypothetical protein
VKAYPKKKIYTKSMKICVHAVPRQQFFGGNNFSRQAVAMMEVEELFGKVSEARCARQRPLLLLMQRQTRTAESCRYRHFLIPFLLVLRPFLFSLQKGLQVREQGTFGIGTCAIENSGPGKKMKKKKKH